MDKKNKRNVKIGSKKGLVFYVGDVNDIDDFISLMEVTASRDGFTYRDKSYFVNFLNKYGDDAKLVFARLNFDTSIKILKDEIISLEKDLAKEFQEIAPKTGNSHFLVPTVIE